jgi:hypothetical protein
MAYVVEEVKHCSIDVMAYVVEEVKHCSIDVMAYVIEEVNHEVYFVQLFIDFSFARS